MQDSDSCSIITYYKMRMQYALNQAKVDENFMIILINGASGAGKTFLLERLTVLKGHDFVPLKKYTTRSERKFEKSGVSADLVYNCTKVQIDSLPYNYPYKNELYGINADEILKIIANGHIPVIIVRSFKTIRRIKEDFDNVKAFFIVGAQGETLKQKLLSQGRSADDIEASQKGADEIIHECMENVDLIDHYILNCLYDEESYIKQFMKYAV